MLVRLARWLRLFGYDTLVIPQQENEDELLLEIAEKEGRILVSRDRVLVRKATTYIRQPSKAWQNSGSAIIAGRFTGRGSTGIV